LNPVFIDTSYLIALEISDDQFHPAALTHWRSLASPRLELVTTSYILSEVAAFLNSRGHHAKAVEVGERLLTSRIVRFLHIDEPTFREAWAFFSRHSDKDYSLADCISFVVMKEMGIRQALTFDRHFIQAGFEPLPSLTR
jgi:predicted nucleic acid-binding protein